MNEPSRAILTQPELERLQADASLARFLTPLFTQFEEFVTNIAESRFEGASPALVRAAQELLVMTPERAKRWGWGPQTAVHRRMKP